MLLSTGCNAPDKSTDDDNLPHSSVVSSFVSSTTKENVETPPSTEVPELGTYITSADEITDGIIQKLLNTDTWDSLGNAPEFFEGYLLHSSYIGEVRSDIQWDGDTSVGLWLVAVNRSYWDPYEVVKLTDIRVYSNGDVKAHASNYNPYDFSDEERLERFKREWNFEQITPTPCPEIEADFRPQVELFKDLADDLTYLGNNGCGIIGDIDLGDEGDKIWLEGDLNFVLSNTTSDIIQVVKDHICIAEFNWGFSKSTELKSGEIITVGIWFTNNHRTLNVIRRNCE